LLAASHVPERQDTWAFAGLQTPEIGAAFVMTAPFWFLGVQTLGPVPWHQQLFPAHNGEALQSESDAHTIPQAPVVVLHVVPPGWPAQSALFVHLPHEPALQTGDVVVGHEGWVRSP